MIYVIATLRIRPETHDAFLAGARDCIKSTRLETGCISYDLTQSMTEPACFIFVERWDSRDALANHFTTDHMRVWREISGSCVTDRKVEIIAPEAVETR